MTAIYPIVKRLFASNKASFIITAADDDFSSCTAIYAALLVWVADGCRIGSNYLHFYTDCTSAAYLGRIF